MRRDAKTQSTFAARCWWFALLVAAAVLLTPAAQAAANPTMTVSKTGTGAGWVHSSPGGINCGTSCTQESASFEHGTVTLIASGAQFAGWTSCPGTASGRECTLSLTEDKEAIVKYSAMHVLTVSKTGTGTGWVYNAPSEINCAPSCTTQAGFFASTATVTVTASGAGFAGWASCPGIEVGRHCEIEMAEDREAVAEFRVVHALTVAKIGSGNGWVHSSPEGINCGTPCTQKSASFENGTFTLIASGAQFAGWTSCPGTASGRECTLDLTEDKEAIVKYSMHALTVSKTGTGAGWVYSEPSGINCGTPCTTQAGLFAGAVTVTASGAGFAGWASCPGIEVGRSCEIEMVEDREAVAKFRAVRAIAVTKIGSGNGWVQSSPEGINCGLSAFTCTGYFDEGIPITLTAYGAEFSEWTRCPGSVVSRECTIGPGGDQVAEVRFG